MKSIFQQAYSSHKLGDFGKAIELYQAVLAQQPKHCETLYNLATLYAQSGSWHAAVEHYQRALTISQDAPEILYNLSVALLNCKQFGAAITNLQRLLTLAPEFGEAHHLLACLLYKTQHQQEAITHFEQAIKLGPEIAQAHFNFGVMLLEGHQPKLAKEHFQQAIEQQADFAEAHYNLGIVLETLGDAEAATAALLTACQDEDYEFAALSHLAFIAKRQGEIAAAIDYCNRGLALQEDSGLECLRSYLAGENEAPLPEDFIKRLFNQYASTYDQHLRETLGYRGPEQLLAVFAKQVKDFDFTKASVLDLGCGTGLMARALPDDLSYLAGVDLSEQMLELANFGNNYDDLFCQDVIAYLNKCRDKFDLVVAADLLPYVSELSELLAAVAGVMKDGGYFLFSFEQGEAGSGSGLGASLRYQHDLQELEQVVAEPGCWRKLACETASIRHQEGAPQAGGIMLLVRQR